MQAPDIVTAATEAYPNEQDAVGQFIADKCVVSETARAGAKDLWESFNAWRVENDAEPMSRTAFGRRLTERGFAGKRDSLHGIKPYVYRGIGLIQE